MNFRTLIEQAMHETQHEFAAIVQRKLHDLLGESTISTRAVLSPRRGPGRPKKTAKVPAKAAKPARKNRERAPRNYLAGLRDQVIGSLRMAVGPVGRVAIMKAAGIAAADGVRVTQVLGKLKKEGFVVMSGTKGSALYTYAALMQNGTANGVALHA